MLVTLLPPAEAGCERTESEAREMLRGRDDFFEAGEERGRPRLRFPAPRDARPGRPGPPGGGRDAARVPCETDPADGLADVVHVISNARLFVGTSLHGVLTAAAWGVRALPLATPDPKLASNLESWEIPGLERCVGLEELPGLAKRTVPPAEARIESLRRQVWRNFEALVKWL